VSITAANAILMLSIPGLVPVPQQIQGFAADDVYDVDAIESAEVSMGVDGVMTAGFVYVPVKQNFTLQADSESVGIFDLWWATQQQAADVFYANGGIVLPSLGTKWTQTRGALTSWKPVPDAKKLLQPRKFTVTWQSIIPAVIA
jgi:hypothetical protein